MYKLPVSSADLDATQNEHSGESKKRPKSAVSLRQLFQVCRQSSIAQELRRATCAECATDRKGQAK